MSKLTGTEIKKAQAIDSLKKFNIDFLKTMKELVEDEDNDGIDALNYLKKELDALVSAEAILWICDWIDVEDYGYCDDYRKGHGAIAIRNAKALENPGWN